MRHVLVAGVGFVGLNLAEELAKRGDEVIVVARYGSAERRPRIASRLREAGARIVVGERISRELLLENTGDTYYVLAGRIKGSLESMREAHVGIVEETIGAARETGSRVVLVSSIAALGIPRLPEGSTILEEERHLEGEREYATLHMLTKAEGERVLVSSGLDKWSIIRPGVVLGPYNYHIEARALRTAVRLGFKPVLGRGIPHIYSRDLAAILAEAGAGKYDRLWVNAVDPRHPDLAVIAGYMCSILGRRCLGIPAWWGLSIAGRLAGRGSPLKLAYSIMSRRFRYASRHLEGFRWTGLEEQARGILVEP